MHPTRPIRVTVVAAALLLVAVTPRAAENTTSSDCSPELRLSTTSLSGQAPFTITITGKAHCAQGFQIDWGDGERLGDFVSYPNDYLLDATHTYPCPGEFECRVSAFGYDTRTLEPVSVEATEPVSVSEMAPDPKLTAWVSDVIPQGDIYIQLQDDVSPHLITHSTVNWGDATPSEDFKWVYQVGQWKTPFHDIDNAVSGSFVATVTNVYGDDACTIERTVRVPWSIRSETGVQTTTWGRIKALYEQ